MKELVFFILAVIVTSGLVFIVYLLEAILLELKRGKEGK